MYFYTIRGCPNVTYVSLRRYKNQVHIFTHLSFRFGDDKKEYSTRLLTHSSSYAHIYRYVRSFGTSAVRIMFSCERVPFEYLTLVTVSIKYPYM